MRYKEWRLLDKQCENFNKIFMLLEIILNILREWHLQIKCFPSKKKSKKKQTTFGNLSFCYSYWIDLWVLTTFQNTFPVPLCRFCRFISSEPNLEFKYSFYHIENNKTSDCRQLWGSFLCVYFVNLIVYAI